VAVVADPILDKPVSNARRRPAEYGRFGGAVISMAGQSNPQQGQINETAHPVLLLPAKDLVFYA